MDKIAQERGLASKLREKVNISGKILETVSEEFKATMEKMRSTDAQIRESASSVRDMVRYAASFANRRDYLSAAINISSFHERCRYIAALLSDFEKNVNVKHFKVLLDQFDDEQKQKLFGYDPMADISLADVSAGVDKKILLKTAGLSDWWMNIADPLADLAYNLSSGKASAMKAMEKHFSFAFLSQLKKDTVDIVEKSNRFLKILLSIFSELGKAVATRKVGKYLDNAKKYVLEFSKYHKDFLEFYKKDILPLRDFERGEQEEKSRQMEEASQIELSKAPKSSVKIIEDETKPKSKPSFPTQKEKEELLNKLEEPSDEVKEKLQEMHSSAEYNNFIFNLEKFATADDHNGMIKEILSYSSQIEDNFPTESLQLIAVAEGMFDKYKKKVKDVYDVLKDKPEENKPTDGEDQERQEYERLRQKFEASKPIQSVQPSKPALFSDIPEGLVNESFQNIQSLRSIGENGIRFTPNAISHIIGIFKNRLITLHIDVDEDLSNISEGSILSALRSGIARGIVLTNRPSDDVNNPKDRQLEISIWIDLHNLSDNLKGTARMKVLTRLMATNKILSVRTIQRNFTVEGDE